MIQTARDRGSLTIAPITEADRETIYRIRHDVYGRPPSVHMSSRPMVRGTKKSSEIASSSSRNLRRTKSWSQTASQSVASTLNGCRTR